MYRRSFNKIVSLFGASTFLSSRGVLANQSNREIIIVGAGISGLMAAYELVRKGFKVKVLESETKVGGRFLVKKLFDKDLDQGVQFFLTNNPIVTPLAKKLGMKNDMLPFTGDVGVYYENSLHRVNSSQRESAYKSGLLGAIEFASWSMWHTYILGLSGKNSLSNFSTWADVDDESIYTFARTSKTSFFPVPHTRLPLSRRMFESLVETMIEAIYFYDSKLTSKALYFWGTKYFSQSHRYFTFKGGMASFTERLKAELLSGKHPGECDFEFGVKVDSVKNTNVGGVEVKSGNSIYHADKCILTVPSVHARKMYLPESKIESQLMSNEYVSTIKVTYYLSGKNWRDSKKLKNIGAIWIPPVDQDKLSSIKFYSSFDKSLGNDEIVEVFLNHRTALELLDKSDEEISSAILPEVDKLVDGINDSHAIRGIDVHRWHNALPEVNVGRATIMREYRLDRRANPTNVILAGDYTGAPCTDGAAETGIWAAKNI